jgi:hypothetical protein
MLAMGSIAAVQPAIGTIGPHQHFVGLVNGQSTKTKRTIMVTEADNGHRYHLHKGDGLDVQLSGPSSSVIWTEPASSNQAVLQRTGGSSGATATGTFKAIAKGKVQVTATGTFTCTPPCPGPIMLFEVTVSVAR